MLLQVPQFHCAFVYDLRYHERIATEEFFMFSFPSLLHDWKNIKIHIIAFTQVSELIHKNRFRIQFVAMKMLLNINYSSA